MYRPGILLIHGNGEDVTSDVAWHKSQPDMEQIIDAWCVHANNGAAA